MKRTLILFFSNMQLNLHINLPIIYTFITYILNFFLPEQNAPDYATIGHTRASVRRMLSVCGGYSSGKHEADKRLLYCKQSADLRRLSFSPFQTGLFCVGPKLRPLRYQSPGGRFNSITVCCTLRWVVTLNVLSVEKGPWRFLPIKVRESRRLTEQFWSALPGMYMGWDYLIPI